MERGSKIDDLMTMVFMLLAVATVACLFFPSVERSVMLTLGGFAIVLRVIQYVLRFF